MADRWIVVPNWQRFQHYGLARPPNWIKNYTALLHKDEYLDLPLASRGLLHGIWLAYADRRGRIREGRDLAAELHARVTGVQLESLNEAGLVGFSASKPLTLNLSEEPPREPARAREAELAKAERHRRAAENWIRNGAAAEVPDGHLAEVLSADFKITDPEHLDHLLTQAAEWGVKH